MPYVRRAELPASASLKPGSREALLSAFAKLVLSKRYPEFGVDAIVGAANVARSTFYYHFAGKDDLLLNNLRPLISSLAAMPFTSQPSPDLQDWITHLWEQRQVAGRLLVGATGKKI